MWGDFKMQGEIGSHDGQSTRHRLDQRMSKRFGISRGYVDVAGTIEVMKRAIGNGSELYDIPASLKIVGERCRRLGTICPRILVGIQAARKKEFRLPSLETTVPEENCPE